MKNLLPLMQREWLQHRFGWSLMFLIPLALRGVRYRPLGAAQLFRRSMLVYGVGGVLAVTAGLSVAQACVMSLLVFTGASQFVVVGVLMLVIGYFSPLPPPRAAGARPGVSRAAGPSRAPRRGRSARRRRRSPRLPGGSSRPRVPPTRAAPRR